MEKLKLENTVVNVKSQDEFNEVTDYYDYDYDNNASNEYWFTDCKYKNISLFNNVCGNNCYASGYKVISFLKWLSLVKEHENKIKQKREQEMSKSKEIKSFEDFKRVAREYISNGIKDDCKYIGFDDEGFSQFDKKPKKIGNRYSGWNYIDFSLNKNIGIHCGKEFLISLAELRNEPPKLEDLESGCGIETSDGDKYVVIKKYGKAYDEFGDYIEFDDYNSKLEDINCDSDYNIIKITSPDGNLIWERQKESKERTVELADGVNLTADIDTLKSYAEKLNKAING